MSKTISSISVNGLKVSLHSGEEGSFVCFYIKKKRCQCFIDNPKSIENLGNWLLAASEKIKEKEKK